MNVGQRFVPGLKLLWLALLRNNLPRDLRNKITTYAAKHVFVWETDLLRQERMNHAMNVVDVQLQKFNLLTRENRALIVEPWEPQFLLLGDLRLRCVYTPRKYRAWPKQRYYWVWLMHN